MSESNEHAHDDSEEGAESARFQMKEEIIIQEVAQNRFRYSRSLDFSQLPQLSEKQKQNCLVSSDVPIRLENDDKRSLSDAAVQS